MEAASEAALTRLREYPDKAQELLADLGAKNDKGAKIEPWKEDQLNKFVKVLIGNVGELEAAYLQGSLSKTAWAARNLLELSKVGLPDVVVDKFGWSSGNQMSNLINLFSQAMVEGRPSTRPALSSST
jgi:hypothetical protein